MDAKGDVTKSQDAVQAFAAACKHPKLIIKLPATSHAQAHQVPALEKDLMTSVEELKTQKQVFGPLPSIDDLVSPAKEKESSEGSPHAFPDEDHKIVGLVQQEIWVQKGEVIEIDCEDSNDEDSTDMNVSHHDTIDLVIKLKQLSIKFGGPQILELTWQLHHFHGFLHHEELLNGKQSSLDDFSQ